MLRFFSFLSLTFLLACGHAPDLIGVDNSHVPVASVPGAQLHKVFITTTRARTTDSTEMFGPERSGTLGLASVTVSVPPGHVPGVLERPKRLPPDPSREFAVIDPIIYDEGRSFIDAINVELSRRPPAHRDVLLFVHGYNNSLSDAVLRMTQFVEDTGFKGVPVLFSFASAAKATSYVYDLNSALAARPFLEDASGLLVQTNARRFDVFAHSMGALLLTEVMVQSDIAGTLGESGHLSNIMLAAPDIDLYLFRSQLSQIRNNPGNIIVFLSRDDEALRASRMVAGGEPRVGAVQGNALEGLGVTVIDLSEVHIDGTSSHSKFASSPDVVRLIGAGLQKNTYSAEAAAPTVFHIFSSLPLAFE